MQKLTQDTLKRVVNKKTGKYYIVIDKKYSKKELSDGTNLLRETIGDMEHTATIQFNKFTAADLVGKNFVTATAKGGYLKDDGTPRKGSSSNIYFYPEEDFFKGKHQIAIGHELIHAHHMMTGTAILHDSAKVKKDGWTEYKVGGITYRAPYEELVTTGIMQYSSYPTITTENALRKEQGFSARNVYRYDWK